MFYHYLPENRLKLPEDVIQNVREKLQVRGNKKIIQAELLKKKMFLTLET